jgi:hypothetical protein
MLKWIVPVKRKEGVERESFFEFWRAVHAPHVANLTQPLRYCVNFFDAVGSLGGEPVNDELVYDGVAELWFRDFDHFNEAFGEERGDLRGIDGFGDLIEPTTDGLFTTENVIIEPPSNPEAVKWVAFVKMRGEVSREELFQAWNDGHSPRVAESIAKTDGGCVGYTTSHANQGVDSRWDGIASLWYRDAEAARAGVPPSDRPGDPFPPLIDPSDTVILQGKEIVVVSE